MVEGASYHNRQGNVCSKIRSLLISLTKEPSKYDEITSKIGYWIEYVLCESFATVDELVEGVSGVAWEDVGSYTNELGKFLKEFYETPHRSEQARSFVAQLCPYVLRWFAMASTEDLWFPSGPSSLSNHGAPGFVRAASFVGYLIKWGLLSHELVRQHLVKPLTNHHNNYDHPFSAEAVRANAIYQLFTAAGNNLLQGLLEAEEVQVCFKILDSRYRWIHQFDLAKLEVYCTFYYDTFYLTVTCNQEFRNIRAAWVLQSEEGENARETEGRRRGGEEGTVAAEVSTAAKTPVAFAPQDLPVAMIGVGNIPYGAFSPTLSISTVSDLPPTELGEETEYDEKQTGTCRGTIYFEDGNVEIACGDTIFRVHSSVISISSSEFREILSHRALLDAPTPEGRPRIIISDTAEDFATLLKMIYTPGSVSPFPCLNYAG